MMSNVKNSALTSIGPFDPSRQSLQVPDELWGLQLMFHWRGLGQRC